MVILQPAHPLEISTSARSGARCAQPVENRYRGAVAVCAAAGHGRYEDRGQAGVPAAGCWLMLAATGLHWHTGRERPLVPTPDSLDCPNCQPD